MPVKSANCVNTFKMTDKTNLLLVGGGGHCRSVIESIERSGLFHIIGISDRAEEAGKLISGYTINTTDEDAGKLEFENLHCIITVGQIKSAQPRKKLFDLMKSFGFKMATLIDPSAIVSERCEIGEGTVVLRDCFINAGVTIGRNCIINSKAMVEHDSYVGDNVHVSTGAIINGDCHIGNDCFIGSGAVIANAVSIASGSIIGAGAVILGNINTPGTYLGNPGRRIF